MGEAKRASVEGANGWGMFIFDERSPRHAVEPTGWGLGGPTD